MKYFIGIYCFAISIFYLLIVILLSIVLSFVIPVKTIDPWIKRAFRLYLRLLFIRVEVKNAECLNPEKEYIFMPNHSSFFDPVVLNGFIPNYIRGIEKEAHFSWPVYGYFIRRFGNIPINQKSLKKSLESMRQAENYLCEGKSVVVFPEGTRSSDGRIGRFKRLPFMLAKQAKVPIVPVGVRGLYNVLPRDSFWIQPQKVTLTFGEIIQSETIAASETDELAETVRRRVVEIVKGKPTAKEETT